jgi:hypothetical protein
MPTNAKEKEKESAGLNTTNRVKTKFVTLPAQ